jgi:tetratricopeptide (TPR) repeat protein
VETIERLYADRLTEHIERLAHHAFRAETWEKAVTYLWQAGAKAFVRSANREAVPYLEQALTALSHLPETRETREQAIDVRCELRGALFALAEFGRIYRYLQEAETLARSLDDQRRLAWVLAYMASNHVGARASTTEARTCAEQVEAIGETLADVPLQVAAQYYWAHIEYMSGDYQGTENTCRRLMQLMQGGQTRERFSLWQFPAVLSRTLLARSLAERGLFHEGETHGHDAIRIAEALDQLYSLIEACLGLGYLYSIQGNLSQAVRPLERAVALGGENIMLFAPNAMASLGRVYAGLGRVEEGLPWVQQGLAAHDAAGIGYFEAVSLVQAGEAYLLAGQVEDARTSADRAVTLARQRGERGHEAWALRLLGEVASHHDHPDVATAEVHYGAAMPLASELGMRPLVAHCHLGLGKLYRRTGDRAKADEDLTTAATMYREMGMTFWLEKAEAEVTGAES